MQEMWGRNEKGKVTSGLKGNIVYSVATLGLGVKFDFSSSSLHPFLELFGFI
jgi:hypothetical protein